VRSPRPHSRLPAAEPQSRGDGAAALSPRAKNQERFSVNTSLEHAKVWMIPWIAMDVLAETGFDTAVAE
jgi:hypothetical protein